MHASLRVLLVGLLLIFVVAIVTVTRPKNSAEQSPPIPEGVFVFKKGNFSIVLGQGWAQVPNEAVQLPQGVEGLQFVLAKPGTACVLAYSDAPVTPEGTPPNSIYTQTTPGERVYLGKAQIDSWWWAPRADLPAQFTPQFEGRLPLPKEMLAATVLSTIPTSAGFSQFILFTSDGTSVPDICATESYEMLRSLGDAFDTATLTAASRGHLRVHSSYIDSNVFLSFRPSDDSAYQRLPVSIGAPIGNLVVYGDMLYTLRDGAIEIVDVFKGTTGVLPGISTSTNTLVNDFYIKGDKLWFLSGQEGCNEYKATCDLDVFEMPAAGGTPKFLGRVHLETGFIVGFDETNQKLYVMSAFGDAGAYSYTIFEYDYATSLFSEAVSDEGYDGDSPEKHAEARAKRSAIESAVGIERRDALVQVQNGHLSKPSTTEVIPRAYTEFIYPY
jgi:hypothetical protein